MYANRHHANRPTARTASDRLRTTWAEDARQRASAATRRRMIRAAVLLIAGSALVGYAVQYAPRVLSTIIGA